MSPKYEILHEFCYNTQKTPDISALMYAFPAIFYFYVGVVVAAAAAIDVAVASAARRFSQPPVKFRFFSPLVRTNAINSPAPCHPLAPAPAAAPHLPRHCSHGHLLAGFLTRRATTLHETDEFVGRGGLLSEKSVSGPWEICVASPSKPRQRPLITFRHLNSRWEDRKVGYVMTSGVVMPDRASTLG